MIEKLKRYIREEDGIKISCPPDNVHIISKINELIDAVNEIMTWRFDCDDETPAENVQPDAESRPENVQKRNHWDDDEVQRYGAVARGFKSLRKEPADPYAEQRRWIGKLCKFWDNDGTQQLSYGVLTKIDTMTGFGVQYCCNDEYDYDDCEPVKPDDLIIYKGGDNE